MSFEPLFVFLGILGDVAHQCEPVTSLAFIAAALAVGHQLGAAARDRSYAREFVLVPRRRAR